MALSSSSTPAQIENQYLDNSAYDQPPSVPAAYLFVQACRCILLRRPSRIARGSTGGGNQSLEYDLEQIRNELNRALFWLAHSPDAQAQTGADTSFPDFSFSRDY
jgi:hypothetical protein